jgi:HlyD family secretion protein
VTNFVVKIRIDPESYEHLLEQTGNIPFRPGMSSTVDIYTEIASDALTVPIAAVTTRDLKAKEKRSNKDDEDEEDEQKKASDDEDIKEVVFVFEADTARMAEVVTGIQDNEYIEILNGLKENEEVVSGPYSAISRTIDAGDRLRKKKEEEEKKKKKKND